MAQALAARIALAASVSTPALYRGASVIGRKHDNARLSRAPGVDGADGTLELSLDHKQVDLATGRSHTLRSFFRITPDGSCARALAHDVAVDPSVRICIPSPDGRLQLRVRVDTGANGGAGGDDVLEVWSGGELLRRRPLAGTAGAVYADGVFGEPVFSPDGCAIVMLAERLAPTAFKSYFNDDGGGAGAGGDGNGGGAGAGGSGDGGGNGGADKGEAAAKFRPRRDFGERLVNKCEPVVLIFNLAADAVSVLTAANLGLRAGEHPAHVRFDAAGDGLLFSAYDVRGFKHGLSACLNRPTRALHLASYAAAASAVADAAGRDAGTLGATSGAHAAVPLSSGSFLALRPLPSPDGSRIVCLHRADHFREHSACFELAELALARTGDGATPTPAPAPRALVGLVHERRASADASAPTRRDQFHGIFGFHDDLLTFAFVTPRAWRAGGAVGADALIFQTLVAGEAAVFLCPLADARRGGADGAAAADEPAADARAPIRLRHPTAPEWAGRCSTTLLATLDDTAIVRLSAVDRPPEVYAVSELCSTAGPRWALVAGPADAAPEAPGAATDALPFALAAPRDDRSRAALDALRGAMRGVRASTVRVASGAEALLVVPRSSATPSALCPLVVILHGGPHSVALDAYEPRQAMLLARGCALLLPNYRGSLSYGEAFVRALDGQAGTLDVEDCAELTREAVRSHADCLDASRVCAFGGSHGGFLAGWLAGHPTHRALFRAAVLWNPVIDIGAMLGATDIPEWCAAEALGRDWQFGARGGVWPLSGADVAAMHAASPISVVGNVECAALLVLGAADRRVPPMNGRQWAAALEARGHPCEMHEYPDEGHSLAGAEATAHVSVTIVDWICAQLFERDVGRAA